MTSRLRLDNEEGAQCDSGECELHVYLALGVKKHTAWLSSAKSDIYCAKAKCFYTAVPVVDLNEM